MGYTISHLQDPPGLCVSLAGLVTGAVLREAFEAMRALLQSDGVPHPTHVLWDARAIKVLSVEPADLPLLDDTIRELDRHLREGASAYVFRQGQTDVHLFGKLLAARSPKGRRKRMTFTDYDTALAWLSAP